MVKLWAAISACVMLFVAFLVFLILPQSREHDRLRSTYHEVQVGSTVCLEDGYGDLVDNSCHAAVTR